MPSIWDGAPSLWTKEHAQFSVKQLQGEDGREAQPEVPHHVLSHGQKGEGKIALYSFGDAGGEKGEVQILEQDRYLTRVHKNWSPLKSRATVVWRMIILS